MAGGSAPTSDPRQGQAALMSARTGRDYLQSMLAQSGIANEWAAADRTRQQEVFLPLEDQMISDAQTWASPERMAARTNQAAADVASGMSTARMSAERRDAAMGVRPGSGRGSATARSMNIQEGLARAGARNVAGRQVEAEGDARMADVINMGRGMAVNPATSLGMASNTQASGFSGAMQGYNQSASIYSDMNRQNMQAWQSKQGGLASLAGGIGQIAGLAFFSSKAAKKDKTAPKRSMLKAVRRMPVEEWTYKKGKGDEGRHIGPYAEDFKRETGHGDGRSINVIDAVGSTMGAVKELDRKVTSLARSMKKAA